MEKDPPAVCLYFIIVGMTNTVLTTTFKIYTPVIGKSRLSQMWPITLKLASCSSWKLPKNLPHELFLGSEQKWGPIHQSTIWRGISSTTLGWCNITSLSVTMVPKEVSSGTPPWQMFVSWQRTESVSSCFGFKWFVQILISWGFQSTKKINIREMLLCHLRTAPGTRSWLNSWE